MSAVGCATAYAAISGADGHGNMMLADVVMPFSSPSMVPAFESGHIPASSM
jgi:hypothetical protein